jgi:choline-sulfatase
MNNYLLIISDEHNSFYASPYGHDIIETPNMERMAKAGTLYKNAYCPSPICTPSRSSFFSGKHVHQHQAYNNCNAGLNKDQKTYGEVLKKEGIHTTHIGKVHAYDQGNNLGFSEMTLPGDAKWPGDRFITREKVKPRDDSRERAKGWGPMDDAYKRDKRYVSAALDFLKNSARQETPWVLSLNLLTPHFPHFTNKALWEKYDGTASLPKYGTEAAPALHKQARQLRTYFDTDSFSEQDTLGLIQGYYAGVDYLDQQIGVLLDTLENQGLLETTNVIYTSDHGEMLGKFGMWWKCSLYEDSARIPCIACGPDFKKNQIVETPVTLHDVRASLFESNGLSQPKDWVGDPLQQITHNDENRVAFSEYHGHGTTFSSYMIRKGDWKLIYHIEGGHQLFNLVKDPHELDNCIEKNNQIKNELIEELFNICDPIVENKRASEFTKDQIQCLM